MRRFTALELNWENLRNTILVAAYLGQPLVLRGHHQDLKEGVAIFEDAADEINALGRVVWANLGRLSRLSYRWRLQGTTCFVEPRATELSFQPPMEATEIVLEQQDGVSPDVLWRVEIGKRVFAQACAGDGIVLGPETDGIGALSIRRVRSEQGPAQDVSIWDGIKPMYFARRLLTEARDRWL